MSKRDAHMLMAALLQVELKSGQTYRGELHDAEDNWNCQLKNVTFTERVCRACAICVLAVSALCTLIASNSQWLRFMQVVVIFMVELQDGRISHLDHVFLRGSRIRFMIIPDMLKNAPMFKRIDPKHKVRSYDWQADALDCSVAGFPLASPC